MNFGSEIASRELIRVQSVFHPWLKTHPPVELPLCHATASAHATRSPETISGAVEATVAAAGAIHREARDPILTARAVGLGRGPVALAGESGLAEPSTAAE